VWKLLTRVFGSRNQRLIKELSRTVSAINASSPVSRRWRTTSSREDTGAEARFAAGTALEDLVPEAFALVREASRRKLGLRHFDVQLIGASHCTREKSPRCAPARAKTLMATLPAYLNALSGDGVHVVTVNEYLAQRDSDWMAPVYRFSASRCGVIRRQTQIEAEETVDGRHPIRVALSEVFVHRDHVHAVAREGVQVRRQRRHERLALAVCASRRFFPSACEAPMQLYVEVAQPELAARGLAHQREGLRHQVSSAVPAASAPSAPVSSRGTGRPPAP